MADTGNFRLLDVLTESARELVDGLDADASVLSRVIGDVLIIVAECVDGRTLQMGQGYLVPDYPVTQQVLATRTARTLTLTDEDVDAAEAGVLRELGFASVVLLPLEVGGVLWGLAEIYRREARPFAAAEIAAAQGILGRMSARTGS